MRNYTIILQVDFNFAFGMKFFEDTFFNFFQEAIQKFLQKN